MRFALAICVVVGCALCGSALSASARRRAETLAALIEGIKVLRMRMLKLLEPVAAALSGSGCDILAAVGRAMGPGEAAASAWGKVSQGAGRRGGAIDALDAADRRTLDQLFSQLGETGRERQELLLSAVLNTLERSLDQARTNARSAERLYLSLGLLVGLMLALIVI